LCVCHKNHCNMQPRAQAAHPYSNA